MRGATASRTLTHIGPAARRLTNSTVSPGQQRSSHPVRWIVCCAICTPWRSMHWRGQQASKSPAGCYWGPKGFGCFSEREIARGELIRELEVLGQRLLHALDAG